MLLRAALTSAVLLALAVSTAEAGRIVPQRGIAGVELGMSREKVKAVKGKPKRAEGPIPTGGTTRTLFWDMRGGLRVGFRLGSGGVTSISTTSRRHRTANGVRVGMPRAQVKRRLRGEHCVPQFCLIGDQALGSRNTTFLFGADGRVTQVDVYRQREQYVP